MATSGLDLFFAKLPPKPPAHVVQAASGACDSDFIAHLKTEIAQILQCDGQLFQQCVCRNTFGVDIDSGLSPEQADIAAKFLIECARLNDSDPKLPPLGTRIEALRASPRFLETAWVAVNTEARQKGLAAVAVESKKVAVMALAAALCSNTLSR